MRVLVIPASRHGGTAEIGRAMARTLRDEGVDVDVSQPEQMFNLAPYAAHVIGSGLYLGDWLEPARTFIEEHGAALQAKPTWLFSSGPIGPATPPEPIRPEVLDRLVGQAGAIEHRLFGGRLELDRLPTAERYLAQWVGAADCDQRDWDEIERWARTIARAVRSLPEPKSLRTVRTLAPCGRPIIG